MGREEAGRLRTEGAHVYLCLIHADVWQKPKQYCKATILQLKINNLKKKKGGWREEKQAQTCLGGGVPHATLHGGKGGFGDVWCQWSCGFHWLPSTNWLQEQGHLIDTWSLRIMARKWLNGQMIRKGRMWSQLRGDSWRDIYFVMDRKYLWVAKNKS